MQLWIEDLEVAKLRGADSAPLSICLTRANCSLTLQVVSPMPGMRTLCCLHAAVYLIAFAPIRATFALFRPGLYTFQ